MGAALTLALLRGPLTPNMLSLLALVMFVPAAIYIGLLDRPAPALGAAAFFIWMQLTYAVDCTDGQLARTRGQASDFGQLLDRVCDFVGRLVLMSALVVFATRALSLSPVVAVGVACFVLGLQLAQLFATLLRSAIYGKAPAVPEPMGMLRVAMAGLQVLDYGILLLPISVGLSFPGFLLGVLLVYSALMGLLTTGQLALNWQSQQASGRPAGRLEPPAGGPPPEP